MTGTTPGPRRTLLRAWLGAAIMLLLWCALCQDRAAAEPCDLKGEDFVWKGWILGQTISDLRTRVGKPLKTQVRKIENRHVPGQMDEVHELFYDSLRVEVYRMTETPPRELFLTETVTHPRYDVACGLRVGVSRQMVMDTLGSDFTTLSESALRERLPRAAGTCSDTPCALTYGAQSGYGAVYFFFRNGRVSRIDWLTDSD